jgi:ethanolamine utilization protein EutN
MLIARVIGEAIATHKHECYEGLTVLVVQPLELDGSPRGVPLVAVDAVGAGTGQLVLVAPEGYCAMSAVNRMQTPMDAAVLGIVDHVDLSLGLTTQNAAHPAAG